MLKGSSTETPLRLSDTLCEFRDHHGLKAVSVQRAAKLSKSATYGMFNGTWDEFTAKLRSLICKLPAQHADAILLAIFVGTPYQIPTRRDADEITIDFNGDGRADMRDMIQGMAKHNRRVADSLDLVCQFIDDNTLTATEGAELLALLMEQGQRLFALQTLVSKLTLKPQSPLRAA